MTVELDIFQPKAPTSEELANATPEETLEYSITTMPEVVCPLTHLFTPGLYVRKIFMPAGSLVSSRTHATRHPFIIAEGKVDVISPFERFTYEAPFMGVTEPGTKRFLYTHTDTVWLTIHANPENISDPDELTDKICEAEENSLIYPNDPRYTMWKTDTSPSTIINLQ